MSLARTCLRLAQASRTLKRQLLVRPFPNPAGASLKGKITDLEAECDVAVTRLSEPEDGKKITPTHRPATPTEAEELATGLGDKSLALSRAIDNFGEDVFGFAERGAIPLFASRGSGEPGTLFSVLLAARRRSIRRKCWRTESLLASVACPEGG
jgi:hypothetical protein